MIYTLLENMHREELENNLKAMQYVGWPDAELLTTPRDMLLEMKNLSASHHEGLVSLTDYYALDFNAAKPKRPRTGYIVKAVGMVVDRVLAGAFPDRYRIDLVAISHIESIKGKVPHKIITVTNGEKNLECYVDMHPELISHKFEHYLSQAFIHQGVDNIIVGKPKKNRTRLFSINPYSGDKHKEPVIPDQAMPYLLSLLAA
ncbi:MAG TPA: hypothetical protein VJB08_04435 [Candidatus Nanoarchaeia archaeon]|nr:hypothetical protein [Candidatus Nanoarchaeia archaeon]